jgi:hypothetical protein
LVNNKLRSLTPLEKEYLNIVAKFFEIFYHSETEAKVLALLQLKARSKETSFSQKDLMEVLKKSKATISRTMNALIDRERCKYFIEEKILNSGTKKKIIVERKYYTEQNFKDIIINRMSNYIEEFGNIKTRIQEIKNENINDKLNQSESLKGGTEEFIKILSMWIEVYITSIEIFKEN